MSYGLSKVIYLQCFLIISFIFSNCFKSSFKLGYWKGFMRRRIIINREGTCRPFFGGLNYKDKTFVKFCCSLNFYNFFLDCLCNFSTRLSSTFILETKKIETYLQKMKTKRHSSECHLLKRYHLFS